MSADSITKVLHPGGEKKRLDETSAQLAEDMVQRWHRGERPRADEYLDRHPELRGEPEAAIRLIYEEVCLRQEQGEVVAAQEILDRFPSWHKQLEVLLDCHRLLDPPSPTQMPAVDEALGEFILLAELGRGVHGRVYLASQPTLAERLVVLKITPRTGQEHLLLARLQHTHIMPLYAVHDDPQRNLRTMCMPYFAGASLRQVLDELSDVPVPDRTGLHLLHALDRAAARGAALPGAGVDSALEKTPTDEPARQHFLGISYAQAICWIGACLADALAYAHERGLVHLDLKPSNVLLAADGQPMLLDFHIAQKPIPAGGRVPEGLGGTPAYMPPEQQSALEAVHQGEPVPAAVDERADLYSLGLVLYEALGGTVPLADRHSVASLHRSNAQVSVGLADLIGKCLSFEPSQRYARADLLAADLRRHLHDLPLEGVRNRSLRERWRKWRRRQPHSLGFCIMALAVLGAALALGLMSWDRAGQDRRDAAAALAEGKQALKDHALSQAVDSLTRARTLSERASGTEALSSEIDAQLELARHAVAAEQLHRLVERLRFLVGASSLPAEEASNLAGRWRAVWEKRVWLKGRTTLGPALQQRLDEDLLDLGMIWADLRVRLAVPARRDEARAEALRILAETEALFGSRYVLSRQQQTYATALGQKQIADAARKQAAKLRAQSAWEYFALGRTLLEHGELPQAAAALEEAITLQPNAFWPHFYAGIGAYRRERFEEAVTEFRVCIALKPDSAACYNNRGLALAALGRREEALLDYERALKLDPHFEAATQNRALLLSSQK